MSPNHLESLKFVNCQRSHINLLCMVVGLTGFRRLRNNAFSGNLNMTGGVGPQLTYIDLQDNDISAVSLGDPGYTNTLV